MQITTSNTSAPTQTSESNPDQKLKAIHYSESKDDLFAVFEFTTQKAADRAFKHMKPMAKFYDVLRCDYKPQGVDAKCCLGLLPKSGFGYGNQIERIETAKQLIDTMGFLYDVSLKEMGNAKRVKVSE